MILTQESDRLLSRPWRFGHWLLGPWLMDVWLVNIWLVKLVNIWHIGARLIDLCVINSGFLILWRIDALLYLLIINE